MRKNDIVDAIASLLVIAFVIAVGFTTYQFTAPRTNDLLTGIATIVAILCAIALAQLLHPGG